MFNRAIEKWEGHFALPSLFIFMINDGVVNIPAKEEKAINAFIENISNFYNKNKSAYIDKSDMAICSVIKQYANEISPKYHLEKIFWRFVYEVENVNKAGYIPKHNEIFVNLVFCVKKPKERLGGQAIDFKAVTVYIYHEWVHYKQDILVKKKHSKGLGGFFDMYNKTAYHDVKWEQMALARQEIEWIKQRIRKVTPEEVMKWLREWGLMSDPALIRLKNTNPMAYKRILKYAVMFILKKQAKAVTKTR